MKKVEYEKPVLEQAEFGNFVAGASVPGNNPDNGNSGGDFGD